MMRSLPIFTRVSVFTKTMLCTKKYTTYKALPVSFLTYTYEH